MLKDQRFHGSFLQKGNATSSRPEKVDNMFWFSVTLSFGLLELAS